MTGSVRERLVGVWSLRSIRDRDSGGAESDAPGFGSDPAGRLIYTASGHVAVNFMKRSRTLWSSEDGHSEAERASAAAGYGAYAGRFTVGEAEGIVIHHVEVALIPNRIGTDLIRAYSLKENDSILILRPPPFVRDNRTARTTRMTERALMWERIG